MQASKSIKTSQGETSELNETHLHSYHLEKVSQELNANSASNLSGTPSLPKIDRCKLPEIELNYESDPHFSASIGRATENTDLAMKHRHNEMADDRSKMMSTECAMQCNNKFDDRSTSPKTDNRIKRMRRGKMGGGPGGGRSWRKEDKKDGGRECRGREENLGKEGSRNRGSRGAKFEMKKEYQRDYKRDQPYRYTAASTLEKRDRDESKCQVLSSQHGKSQFVSISQLFESKLKSRLTFANPLELDPGPEYIKKETLESIKEKYEEKLRELTFKEDTLEDNLMDEHRSYGNYIQKRKRNLMDNYQVFMNLNSNHRFKSKLMRAHNLHQYKADLPIYSRKADFMKSLADFDVVVFKSNTGSGKSTQLPQYLLDCTEGRILVTEPRVIAADNVARRVQSDFGYELALQLGSKAESVGYVAGPSYRIDPELTQIVYMSEHECRRQIIRDGERFLDCFNVFMIDEAHELRKQGLLILAILRNLVRKSQGKKKLVVTSATLDTSLFEEYFRGMRLTVMQASTPTFDVEVHYTYFPDLEANLIDNTVCHLRTIFDVDWGNTQHIKKTFKSSEASMPNVLVFLPSVRDIKDVVAHIEADSQEYFKRIKDEVPFVVQELHGALKPKEKMASINPGPDLDGSVIVTLATKIAETAITIKDVYYVLDSGLEREYFYDEVTKMSFVKETKISKSSADQRRGRAGRIGNGYCFKMYTLEEELKFRESKLPEVQRMDISDVILAQIKLQHLFTLSDMMFYDKPGFDADKISQVRKELDRINATTTSQNLTKELTRKGEFILRMSCSTQVAAFLFECYKLGVTDLGVIAASSLENVKSCFRERVNTCKSSKY